MRKWGKGVTLTSDELKQLKKLLENYGSIINYFCKWHFLIEVPFDAFFMIL